MLSVFTTKISANKGSGRKLWKVMEMFMTLMLVIVQVMYLHPNSSRFMHEMYTAFYMSISPP